MFTVGTRELKDRLTHYLRLVRQGTTLIVTDRGKPIAVVKPATGDEVSGHRPIGRWPLRGQYHSLMGTGFFPKHRQ